MQAEGNGAIFHRSPFCQIPPSTTILQNLAICARTATTTNATPPPDKKTGTAIEDQRPLSIWHSRAMPCSPSFPSSKANPSRISSSFTTDTRPRPSTSFFTHVPSYDPSSQTPWGEPVGLELAPCRFPWRGNRFQRGVLSINRLASDSCRRLLDVTNTAWMVGGASSPVSSKR